MVRGHLTFRSVETADLLAIDALIERGFGRGSRPVPDAAALPAGEIRFVASSDDVVVGFGAARSYGVAAYVGPLVVRPDLRRRGIASELLARLAHSLERMGARTLLLDAADENVPLYERFGFATIDATDVYERHVVADLEPARNAIDDGSLARALAIDRRIAGCDREAVMRTFARDASAWLALRESGYLFARGRALGPWLADDAATAAALLGLALAARPASNVAYVPRSNTTAPAMLREAGFVLDRSLRHLAFGAPSPMRREFVFGQASLGHG